MILKFKIEYYTRWGQQIFIGGSIPQLGEWNDQLIVPMTSRGDGHWECELQLKSAIKFEYKYCIRQENGSIEWEHGVNRSLKASDRLLVIDYWRSNQHLQNVLSTSPFSKAFFDKPVTTKKRHSKAGNLRFSIRNPRIERGQSMAISGNSNELGNWDPKKAVLMDAEEYPLWSAGVELKSEVNIEYKYGIYDLEAKSITVLETGPNRQIEREGNYSKHYINDEYFNHPQGNWRGAGVAIPVFSLRSKNGMGIGEFADLKLLVDWAARTGLKLIQVLPVNDTVAKHTWADSYPYAAISVFALHPIYANIDAIGKLKDEKLNEEFTKKREELNKPEAIDYEAVMKVKSRYFKLKYDEVRDSFLESKEFREFFERNRKWLEPYAAFSYLRDLNKTPDFTNWKKYKTISKKELAGLIKPGSKFYHDIAVHYFIQFHLDRQLKEATQYARLNNVVLKGDIPIGIYRYSVDAWVAPHLYNMEGQAGAPPDVFSSSGQNWGFPTYNWNEMAKDGYTWWKERLTKMADYFDVYRIDHILGFFRIWEIPWSAVEGTLGRFNPSLPLTVDELSACGININYERFCKPYIRDYVINEIFGKAGTEVLEKYLQKTDHGVYEFKKDFDNQRKIKDHFDRLSGKDVDKTHMNFVKAGLLRLAREVIFLDAPMSDGRSYNLNIDLYNTYSFRDLDEFEKSQLLELHRQYFFHRHNEFWREQAMEKLPAIKSATGMLVCGEDLGMVPDCVPGVMQELQILSLAIQRMPNDHTKEFWHPAHTPYLSVCSTGSHDTSTLRAWWEEDRQRSQRFFNQILGNHGEAPFYCEPWIVEQVIVQHLYSPSMWAIFPIQDIMGIDGELKRVFPQDEHINRPEIIPHYWRFRFHLNIEDLLTEDEFNDHLLQLVRESGRG